VSLLSLSLWRPNFRSVTICSTSSRTDVVKLSFITEQSPSIRCLTTSSVFFTLPETNIDGSQADGFTLAIKTPSLPYVFKRRRHRNETKRRRKASRCSATLTLRPQNPVKTNFLTQHFVTPTLGIPSQIATNKEWHFTGC
jgi:hypothetical protein